MGNFHLAGIAQMGNIAQTGYSEIAQMGNGRKLPKWENSYRLSGEDHGLGLRAVDLELPIGAVFLHYVYGFLKSLFSC